MPAARIPVAETPEGKAVLEALSSGLAQAPVTTFLGDIDATLGLSVIVAPKKELPVTLRVFEGRVALAEGPAEPQVVFTISTADAGSLLSGEVDPSVAFMRGRLKPAGDNELLLRLLEKARGGALAAWAKGL